MKIFRRFFMIPLIVSFTAYFLNEDLNNLKSLIIMLIVSFVIVLILDRLAGKYRE